MELQWQISRSLRGASDDHCREYFLRSQCDMLSCIILWTSSESRDLGIIEQWWVKWPLFIDWAILEILESKEHSLAIQIHWQGEDFGTQYEACVYFSRRSVSNRLPSEKCCWPPTLPDHNLTILPAKWQIPFTRLLLLLSSRQGSL